MGRGRRRKKKHANPDEMSEKDKTEVPRCFVVKRGVVGERVQSLIQDFRQVMSPNCAKKLKESKHNRLEDFVAVAGHFHITHIVIFSSTKLATWMRVAKVPQGPTLTFKVQSFSLTRDVVATMKRPSLASRNYEVSALQVLNGFGGLAKESVNNLASEMLRGLFPAVDVPTFNQGSCRRAVLFHLDQKEDVIQFRHYAVAKKLVGVQRGITKLMRTFRPPKLGHCNDIADFVLSGGAGASESEMDEPQEVPTEKRSRMGVRLVETGPRLTLQLVKAEEGLCTGTVLYHRFRSKLPTQQEIEEAKAREKRKLKARNDKLEEIVGAQKAKRKERAKRQRERQAGEDEDDEGLDGLDTGKDDGKGKGKGKGKRKGKGKGKGKDRDTENGKGAGKGDASDDEPAAKKRRFHPFSWGAGRRGAKDGPAEQGEGGKKKGGGKKRESVLEKFHRSAQG